MKKIIVFLTAALCFCSANKVMAYDFYAGVIYYNITSSSSPLTVEVTYYNNNYNSYSGAVVIPATVTYYSNTYSVTSIGNSAFRNCNGLTSVTIPNSVTSIGQYAFDGCSGLTNVTIPNSVTSIGSDAFRDCSGLTSISVDVSNTTYSSNGGILFNKNQTTLICYPAGKIGSYTIPNSVDTIEYRAFYGCSGLTSVTIPNSVDTIGNHAFAGCSGLTSVNFNAINCTSMGSSGSSVFSGCSSFSTLNIGNQVQTIPNYAFRYCSGLTNVTIPNSVTTIGNEAFYNCSGLTNVTIPNSVTTIGHYAFSGCSGLTGTLTIPNSVTYIGYYAFYGCSGLTGPLTIPNSVTSIESGAFRGCSGLTNVTIPNSITSIGNEDFYGCSSLTNVTIGNSVTNIGNNAFSGCSGLTGPLTIPNSVTSIGNYAFVDCSSLTNVTIGNSVTTIGNYAFRGCSGLTSVTNLSLVPQNISSNVFYNVNITSCTLIVATSSVSAYQNATVWQDFAPITGGGIFFSARANYPVLGNVTANIPDSLYPANTSVILTPTSLSSSFLGWTSGNISLGNTIPLSFILTQDTVIIANFGNIGSINLSTAGTLKNQPNTTLITQLTVTGNIDARDIRFMRDSMPFLTGLDLSGTIIVTYSGDKGTDNNYSAGYNLTYPNNEMPIYSFSKSNIYIIGIGKTSLTSIKLPAGLTSIGEYAFCGCSGLTSVTIPNSVTSIGNSFFGGYAFYGCSSLTSVTIPNSVTTIGDYAFESCSSLTNVTIGDSVTAIGDDAFSGDSNISIVHFNAINCTYMGNSSSSLFSYSQCPLFTTLTIGSNVQKIPDYAFASTNITEIYTDAVTPPQIFHNTFYNVPNTIPVYVPCGTVGNYKSASFWNNFHNIQEKGVFNITLQSNNSLMGSARLVQAPCQTNVAIIDALANTGYRFVQWTDGNNQNPRTVNVTQDTAFTAIFGIAAQGMYYVSAIANNSSMGTVTGSGDYAANSTATITATAKTGYHFVQWNDGNMQSTRTVTVTQDTTFIASFASSSSPNTYHVTVSANNPSMGTVSGSGDYAANTTVTITATPNTGYRFIQWNDGNMQSIRTITVTQDISFVAEFAVLAANTYHVTVFANSSTMGTVSGSGDYAANTTATITAIPNTGYRFIQWNDGNTQTPRTITVTQDTAFIAEFAILSPNTYRVSVLSNDRTKGSVLGGGDYAPNTTISIGAIANPGYRFVQWDDGITDNPRSITVTQDTAFVATFDVEIGIIDIEASTISVYPNPVTDYITVILPENISNAVFTVYDMQGKTLIRQKIGNKEEISVSNLAAGIYIYNVRTDKESYTGKLIINN